MPTYLYGWEGAAVGKSETRDSNFSEGEWSGDISSPVVNWTDFWLQSVSYNKSYQTRVSLT